MPKVYSRKELDASFICIKNKKTPLPKTKKGARLLLSFYAVTQAAND
jgi:hypothetical protein